jgi:tRNA pseudouridine55 synthase
VLEGLLLVDKPGGWTSHDVVARVRRLARQRRVGHAGTLDPMATGLLVLGLGRATRLLGHLGGSDKDYRATIRLGEATRTDDAEGEVIGGAGVSLLPAQPPPVVTLTPERLAAAVAALTGDIRQRPSAVSAVKVDGVRAYARVRAGQDVELAERPARVTRFLVGPPHPAQGRDGRPVLDLSAEVTCSAGTYVRALARDLGAGLGTGGHLTALRRTRSGCFDVADAQRLDDLAGADLTGPDPAAGDATGRVAAALLPMADAVAAAFPRWDVADGDVPRVASGVRLPWPDALPETGPVGVFDPAGGLLALAERGDDRARYLAVLA